MRSYVQKFSGHPTKGSTQKGAKITKLPAQNGRLGDRLTGSSFSLTTTPAFEHEHDDEDEEEEINHALNTHETLG